MMRSRSTTCVFLILYFGFLLKCCYSQENCRTPDGIEGTCVNQWNCKSFTINQHRNVDPSHLARLRSKRQAYRCWKPDWICCPTETITPGSLPLYHERDVAPDVANHKNINLLPDACALVQSQDRIVNGLNAKLNQFPFMALLQYQTSHGLEFKCGGTIINENYILTAAHCLNDTHAKLVGVRVGEHSIKNETDCEKEWGKHWTLIDKCNPPVQDLKIEEVIVHHQYTQNEKSLPNDIALLRVSTINLTDNISPVCLPRGQKRDKIFDHVIVAGWGSTIPFGQKQPDILQYVGLPKVNKTTCSDTYSKREVKLTKTQICAGGRDGIASCVGDSGGPILVNHFYDGNEMYVQYGVISFGPQYCGINAYPGVGTEVKYYMDWILDNMKP